jgi:Mg-chelatase subunit ChlD
LVARLRTGLGITQSEASDHDLQVVLNSAQNKRFVQGILQELEFGRSVKSFRNGSASGDISRVAKKILKSVATMPMMEALSWFIQGSTRLEFLWDIHGLLSTISSGLEVYRAFCGVLSTLDRRFLFDMYFDERRTTVPERAFESIYSDYSPIVDKVIRLGRSFFTASNPVSELDKRQFTTYLEYCYQTWTLATDASRVAAIKQSVLDKIRRTPQAAPTPPALSSGTSSAGGTSTAAVLVMDVSGSMGDSWMGGVKIESAKQAALDFIDLVRQEALATGEDHRIAVVGFSTGSSVLLALTGDFELARRAVINLQPKNSTNLGAGIAAGLSELRKVTGNAKRFMILLSDGMTNTGLGRDDILSGPVTQARQQRICINTVGFGDPGGIDDEFLTRIAQGSGCGSYYYAASGLQLFGAFARIRHQALGQVIPALSSFGKQVTILSGNSISLGTFFLPGDQDELYVTLGWSGGSGLQLQLQDPAGKQVTSTYPGAHVYSATRFSQVILESPQTGFWRVDALSLSPSTSQIEYFSISSTRPGGVAFSLPLPVITVGDQTFALPGGLPTSVVVLISIAALAFAIWKALYP